jgi:hypothetical protein
MLLGSLSFVPVYENQGVSFLQGGQQNSNVAYYQFTGSQIGDIFNSSQGEISFFLKSQYTFAERKALAQYNYRYAFEVRDAANKQFFTFYTQATAGATGRLFLNYAAQSAQNVSYSVPVGQEDTLFGKDVVMKVTISWDGTQSKLYINDSLVKTFTYTPVVANWASASKMTIGSTVSGFYSSNDAVDRFSVTLIGAGALVPPSINSFSVNPSNIQKYLQPYPTFPN